VRAENKTGIGYLQIRVMVDLTRAQVGAHRIVFRTLIGPIPEGITINHRNGIKTDNRPENLELATYSENMRHASQVLKTAKCANQDGEKNEMAKLTAENIMEIRERRSAKEPLKSIAKAFSVSDRTISKIALHQRWQSIK
jgi:hypothetical protein